MSESQLYEYLKRYVSINHDEIGLLFEYIREENFKNKEYLLQQGDICRYKYFILNGLVRTYHIDDKGTEKITQFAIENWWVSNIESFVLERPSEQYIQAIENTTVLKISKEDLESAFQKIPKLERAFRMITENMLIAIQRRYEFYQKKSSKERYQYMVDSLPGFTQRVPQYMIASYLEISPEYLSTVRKGS